jgi:hypothetical protein
MLIIIMQPRSIQANHIEYSFIRPLSLITCDISPTDSQAIERS